MITVVFIGMQNKRAQNNSCRNYKFETY